MRSSPDDCVIELRGVCRARGEGGGRSAIRGVSAMFAGNAFHVITGSSAAERGSLLRMIGLLETPDAGDVMIDGISTRGLDSETRSRWRAQRLGFVFSAPFLLPAFSAVENIAMPLFKMTDVEPEKARMRAESALAFVGLAGREEARADDLTRAEQYSVALARALASDPDVLIVEEVDSILPADGLERFTSLLSQVAGQFGAAVIATASSRFAPELAPDRILQIEGGVVVQDNAPVQDPLI